MTEIRQCLNKATAEDLEIYSENKFAVDFFKYPYILEKLGYLLIHYPRQRKALNPFTHIWESTRPDFEILHPDHYPVIELEVTRMRHDYSLSLTRKRKQVRVLEACHEQNPDMIPLLLTREALTHPIWTLTLIRSIAEGHLNYEEAINFMNQSIENRCFDRTKIPYYNN